MIVTDKLIFLQLQKTACTHIARLLLEDFAGQELFGKHRSLPRRFDPGGRLLVGSVRNPWDWYVSLWAFGCRRRGGPYLRSTGRRSIWKALRDPRARRFVGWQPSITDRIRIARREWDRPVESWRRLHSDQTNPELFRGWLKLVLDSDRRYDLFRDYGHSPINSFAGLLTYLYELLYLRDNSILYRRHYLNDLQALMQHDLEKNILDATIRTEELEKGLVESLGRAGYELTAQQMESIENAERTNSSGRRRRLEDYYDTETVELVARMEKFIIKKYGYRSPLAPAVRAPSRVDAIRNL
ncbi:MAG: hypothetical protein ACREQZ_09045 [Woeseiaceae bacterium]